MRKHLQSPEPELRQYRKPQIIDSGAVEIMTKNDVAPEDWEEQDNIVWGNLYTEITDSQE
ncbi:MAG TPA: hypothetical protein VJ691_08875 [Vicinamibacterales bacterium]|nr:hypothetical protein [Vicinamibacterales bacterium]